MTDILLIDDDKELCELLVEYLQSEGYCITSSHDGESGAEEALHSQYKLVLLDVTLPKMNGFDTLKAIRQSSSIPVIMLTARGDDVDRIVGLELGADDYLPKPFNLRELIARIRAILRRIEVPHQNRRQRNDLRIDDLTLNLVNREARKSDKVVNLTATEFAVLKILIDHSGELVTRKELTRQALNRNLESYDRAIDMHVSNLRNKIGLKPRGAQRIKTVRGSGYFYIIE